jgi:sugar lactone lactonase YvrE
MHQLTVVLLVAAVWILPQSARGQEATPAAKPSVRLIYPNGLAVDRDGQVVISDLGNHSIVRRDAQGRLTKIAGTGKPGFTGDGGPAVDARLNAPFDVLVLRDEQAILIADTYNHRIRRIDREGRITTIAGNGKSALAGDGGPAAEASLQLPQGIAVDSAGNLYIADTFNHVIRRVDSAGMITTVAGSEGGLAGDGELATKAQLNLPMAVAVDAEGCIYISDAGNSRIRRVNTDGKIETVAGFGGGSGIAGSGFAGDGGRPARAKIFSPADIEMGPAGCWYIADSGNNRVRVVREETISTVAGKGSPDFSGDGGSAAEASFKAPQKIALHPDGSVFVADRANRRVRRIDPAGIVTTVAGDGEPGAPIRVADQ